LFVGVRIPYILVLESALHSLTKFGGWRVVPPERMHFTIQFLGDVATDQIELVTQALDRASRSIDSFTIEMKGVGRFGNRIIWAGVEDGRRSMKELSWVVATELEALDLIPDKPFKPHLTIGRAKKRAQVPRDWLDTFKNTPWSHVVVDSFGLISSVLAPSGPQYENLRTFPLTNKSKVG